MNRFMSGFLVGIAVSIAAYFMLSSYSSHKPDYGSVNNVFVSLDTNEYDAGYNTWLKLHFHKENGWQDRLRLGNEILKVYCEDCSNRRFDQYPANIDKELRLRFFGDGGAENNLVLTNNSKKLSVFGQTLYLREISFWY